MKALTTWQPWAALSVDGTKKVETRSRRINYRGRIAIHAGLFHQLDHEIYMRIWREMGKDKKDYFRSSLHYLENSIPTQQFGAIIGTIEIYDCLPMCDLYHTEHDTPLERACGDWTLGRYGILLRNPVKFDKPVPARGQMGLWNWDPEGALKDAEK